MSVDNFHIVLVIRLLVFQLLIVNLSVSIFELFEQ